MLFLRHHDMHRVLGRIARPCRLLDFLANDDGLGSLGDLPELFGTSAAETPGAALRKRLRLRARDQRLDPAGQRHTVAAAPAYYCPSRLFQLYADRGRA